MASLKDAIKKGQKKGNIPSGIVHPWMQDVDNYMDNIVDPVGNKAGDPAGNKAGNPVGNKAGDPAGNKAGDPVGNKAGDPVGNKAGDPVGNKADDPVGNKADDPVGNKAGDPAGDKAGDPAGNKAGDPVGNKVGDPAGNKAGDPAGNKAGDPVGNKVGAPVGNKVGAPVGDKAGNPVGDKAGDPAGDKAGDPAGNKAGTGDKVIKLQKHLYDNEIIRKKVSIIKRKWKPKTEAQKNLNNSDCTFVLLSEIYAARKSVICGFFMSLQDDFMTPRLTSEEGARITNQKKSTFDRTVNRLSKEGILAKYGFKTRAGGKIYWFHPVVYECLKKIRDTDPDYFNY